MGKYDAFIGLEFYPTFKSNIEFYRVRGYDKERKMILTTVFPKGIGNSFDDEIEEAYFFGAFENGDYKAINRMHFEDMKKIYDEYKGWAGELGEEINQTMTIQGFPEWVDYPKRTVKQIFDAECCNRCMHRFGTTSNRDWCKQHVGNSKCYRFKFDKDS